MTIYPSDGTKFAFKSQDDKEIYRAQNLIKLSGNKLCLPMAILEPTLFSRGFRF